MEEEETKEPTIELSEPEEVTQEEYDMWAAINETLEGKGVIARDDIELNTMSFYNYMGGALTEFKGFQTADYYKSKVGGVNALAMGQNVTYIAAMLFAFKNYDAMQKIVAGLEVAQPQLMKEIDEWIDQFKDGLRKCFHPKSL